LQYCHLRSRHVRLRSACEELCKVDLSRFPSFRFLQYLLPSLSILLPPLWCGVVRFMPLGFGNMFCKNMANRLVTNLILLLSTIVLVLPHSASAISLDKEPSTHSQERSWIVGQRVETTSGVVLGHASKNRTQVSEYLGIPFAKPPIGNLRWAAPERFYGTGSINATAYVSPIVKRMASHADLFSLRTCKL
jgi:Carboxylesterase family